MRFALPIFLVICAAHASDNGYIGAAACASCHRAIATTQAATRMAQTWQGTWAKLLPARYSAEQREDNVEYAITRGASGITWRVKIPGAQALTLPVEATTGGSRHGLSLLARVREIAGLRLPRAPLVETRYLYDAPHDKLALSPGFPAEAPTSFETAVGRVLSPQFESKCRTCHGSPQSGAATESGVRCEHCHGPGTAHVKSLKASAIVNPARLTNRERIAQCGACHSDGRKLADPMPEDLLISNQADALIRTECYIQSGEGLSCSTCHNPHRDVPRSNPGYVNACLSCHGETQKQRAAICPVNAKAGCIGCHMPAQQKGSFTMVDHWIRVVPEVKSAEKHAAALRSTVTPKRMFLRMITVPDRAKAEFIRQSIREGASFFKLAQQNSTDESSISGGFLGAMWLDQMDPKLAAAAVALEYGGVSAVVESGGKHFILERLPRDFRWRADRLFEEASALKTKGDLAAALDKNQRALELYPTFLRALLLLGTALGEQGNAARAAAVLGYAVRLYPEDPGAQLNAGIAYGAAGRPEDEIAAYRRALDAEPDLISAYLNLGAALLASGRVDEAAETYRKAVHINPLSAALYQNLAIVYEQQGKSGEAREAAALAKAIAPRAAQSPR